MNIEKFRKYGMVAIKEVIQAGDVFLVKLDCPNCLSEFFCDYTNTFCNQCQLDFSDLPMIEPKRTDYRILCGTKRKRLFAKKTVQNLLSIQEYECAYCSVSLRDQEYHIDHIKPVGFGGSNSISNLCITCVKCNLTAGGLVFRDFYAKREYIIFRRFGKNFI